MLRNVVAIVSGGSSGLGAATASYIVRNGGRVVIADLPSSKDHFLRLAAASCAEVHLPMMSSSADKDSDGRISYDIAEGVACDYDYYPHGVSASNSSTRSKWSGPLMAFAETDVRNEEDVKNALDLAEEQFGQSVNVSVSCAGICPARKTISNQKIPETAQGGGGLGTSSSLLQNIKTHSIEEFNDALQINTLGTFNLARLAAERMAKREPDGEGLRGCIINTASIAAYEGQTGQVAYAASKGAIVGMTLPLARDLSKFGIRVMTIAPGLFKTPLLDGLPSTVQEELGKMVPCPSRLGDPDEFGRLVGSILGNPMLNGEVIRLDGALRMPP